MHVYTTITEFQHSDLALSYGNFHCLKKNIGNNKALKGQGHDFFDNVFSD